MDTPSTNPHRIDSLGSASAPADEPQLREVAPPPVVAIGASAGGLEALKELLAHLSPDTGMGFVVIQHLDPSHASTLASILARSTAMPVLEAMQGMPVAPDHVYVIPPGALMTLLDGRLQLTPRGEGLPLPIDHFLHSLAHELGPAAVGVVLSGTGADGAHGLREIKAAGGATFVQAPASALHAGMPEAAIATGLVDHVLAPRAMAEELGNLALSFHEARPAASVAEPLLIPESQIRAILAEIHRTTGLDLGYYKSINLERRIHRRMLLERIETPEQYLAHLRAHAAEAEALRDDILIYVTRFFRDPELAAGLEACVFPALFERGARAGVRIWTPACATGEEVYSIAMKLVDFMESRSLSARVQIFGTDVNPQVVEHARAGRYSEASASAIPRDYLERFFVREGGVWQVNKAIRSLCVFATHNVLTNPPFSQIDLISCRNLLIYLRREAQQHAFNVFHYALRPGGFLLLGRSESLGPFGELFAEIDKQHRIYAKKVANVRPAGSFVVKEFAPLASEHALARSQARDLKALAGEADRVALARFAPPGFLVNDELEVLQFRGDTARYLSPSPGQATLQLLKLIRPELQLDLRGALYEARRQGTAIRRDRVPLPGGDACRIEVLPVPVPSGGGSYFLVAIDPVTPPAARGAEGGGAAGDGDAREALLAHELAITQDELEVTRAQLRTLVGELESANEKLRTANEELLSSHEELQSTNEELETAKEELESTNEELTTVNEELQLRNSQLARVNDDLSNLIASVEIPIVMVGTDLRLLSFTPTAARLLGLVSSDTGRPLDRIKLPLEGAEIEALIREVMDHEVVQERDVRDRAGRWYALRICPYRTLAQRIGGAVLVLHDVHELKSTLDKVAAARDYAESILENVQAPLVVLDAELRVRKANRAFCDTFVLARDACIGERLLELGGGWRLEGLAARLHELIARRQPLGPVELAAELPGVGPRSLVVTAAPLPLGAEGLSILVSLEDVSSRRRSAAEREQLLAAAEQANRTKDEFLAMLSHELRTPLNAIIGWLGVVQRELSGLQVSPKLARAVETIERNCAAQAQIVNDLLDVSRIIAGKLQLEIQPVDLLEIVRSVIDSLRPFAEDKRITLTFAPPGPLPPLRGDGGRLRQLVSNLVQNALKFTPDEGRIEVAVAAPGGQIELRVADSGVGIAPEFLPHLFERFRQADSSTTRASRGLGLGLALVKHIAEAHGGAVRADSAGVGQGATFVVHLPVGREARSAAVDRPGAVRRTEGPLRVLVVEDDPDSREALVEILAGLGAIVTGAASARAGLAAFREERPDVLVSDIAMPEEDGYSLIGKVRAEEAKTGEHTLAIALTGFASRLDRDAALSAGFDEHMAKPLDGRQLYLRISALLGETAPAGDERPE